MGFIAGAVTLVVGAAFIATGLPWFVRLALCLPAMAAASGFLQASRITCVGRARQGVFENEDFTSSPMNDADVRASRTVASTITRDAVLIGIAAALVGAATALI
jgi:hypothetical protein